LVPLWNAALCRTRSIAAGAKQWGFTFAVLGLGMLAVSPCVTSFMELAASMQSNAYILAQLLLLLLLLLLYCCTFGLLIRCTGITEFRCLMMVA
jgi:hypothetical protein